MLVEGDVGRKDVAVHISQRANPSLRRSRVLNPYEKKKKARQKGRKRRESDEKTKEEERSLVARCLVFLVSPVLRSSVPSPFVHPHDSAYDREQRDELLHHAAGGRQRAHVLLHARQQLSEGRRRHVAVCTAEVDRTPNEELHNREREEDAASAAGAARHSSHVTVASSAEARRLK